MNMRGLLALGVLCATCGWIWAADEIIVTVRQGSFGPESEVGRFDSGEAINLTTAQLEAAAGTANFDFVRIYDSSANPSSEPLWTVGPLSITDNGVWTSSELRVLVAPPPNGLGYGQEDFPFGPNVPIPAGARNFTSFQAIGTNLAKSTRLAVAVSRDIGRADQHDRLEARSLHRIQATGILNDDGNVIAGGNIFADLVGTVDCPIGTCPDDLFFGSIPAISWVQAGNLIAGDVIATEQPFGGNRTIARRDRIDDVRVGPAPNAAGIRGDILARTGSIRQVLTTGPIGSPSRASRIEAGQLIRSIRHGLNDNLFDIGALEADPMYVAIRTGLYSDTDNEPGGGDNGSIREYQGMLQALTTGGDLYGEINTDILFFGNVNTGTAPSGILCLGDLNAPVRVRDMIYRSQVVARRINAPITVGWALKGTIIAFDPSVPQGSTSLASVRVGFEDVGPVTQSYKDRFPRGFLGNDCAPLQLTGSVLDYWNGNVGGGELACSNRPFDGGSIDSLIHAQRAGSIQLAQMTEFFTILGSVVEKAFRPRIEASFLDSVFVDQMRSGVIWSGRDETLFNPEGNSLGNDYTSVPIAVFGCIGPAADVWLTDTQQLDISGDLLGEVHLPSVKLDQTVRIGQALGNQTGQCGCIFTGSEDPCRYTFSPTYPAQSSSDYDNPRNATVGSQGGIVVAERGAIATASPQSLNSQIIIHANAPASQLTHDASKWLGDIIVNEFGDPSQWVVFNTSATTSPSLRGPTYEASPTSGVFGNGAIGQVPFAIHRKASELDEGCGAPPNDAAPSRLQFSRYNRTDTCGLGELDIVFYGPVARPWLVAPLAIRMEAAGTVCEPTAVDATNAVSYAFSDQSRRVRLAAFPGNSFRGPTQYSIAPRTEAGYAAAYGLRCAGLLSQNVVLPLDLNQQGEKSYFTLRTQCEDCSFPTALSCQGIEKFCDSLDFNNDGSLFDPTDVDAFLSVFAEGPCVPDANVCNDVDFNNDGSTFDPADIDSFLSVFGEGPCL